MNWLKHFFPEKESWRLVKTITEHVQAADAPFQKGKLYYHLFESSRGARRADIQTTIKSLSDRETEENAKRFEVYQEKIYRWISGRYDPDIPNYSSVPEDDAVNALRGKIE
jgi:succinate dehydrogenase flavin-adding protein (antitoxin of CptAB toxin-antitoxin module)